ncbi:MAG: RNA-directed DNA polymerase [Pseudomonadota bacterium]
MKRSRVTLDDVAARANLHAAFVRAARSAGDQHAVRRFAAGLPHSLEVIRAHLLEGELPDDAFRSFRIRDPKPRIIHAPSFPMRVVHHALIAHMGPVLEGVLVADTFACIKGRGPLAAVRRAQHHSRRFRYFVHVDIAAYFARIDHEILEAQLARRFKNPALLSLSGRIVDGFHARPFRGLPIGALTSQHFANHYLAGFDRWLLECARVKGMVRYMDDVVWWCDDRAHATATLHMAREWLRDNLALELKPDVQRGRSHTGLSFCGTVIYPGALRLTRRRRRRYSARRAWWEAAYVRGEIDGETLQRNMAGVIGATTHADAASWRRAQLSRRPVAPELLAL